MKRSRAALLALASGYFGLVAAIAVRWLGPRAAGSRIRCATPPLAR